ncbi:MAG: BatA domain-containing protein [Flavobacterium sp.]|nr:BatA domain-containing protein [Flavobacterium sp.]
MHFRHPEILFFLFLLIIPILVHLFQLRRFKKQYFTNVRFLRALSIQTRKSSKIKKWLLLASRFLLLAAVIIAFAQPYFPAKDAKGESNELFVILDNSFSMQAKGQKGELLRRAVEDLLEHAPEGRNFTLITNSESFYDSDIKSIQRDLQTLQYSATPFNLESLAAKVNSATSTYNKDVVIITDGVGLDASHLKRISESDNAFLIIPKAQQKSNASIDSVFVNQILDNFYEIGVKMSVYGEVENDISLSLFNRDKLVAKTMEKITTGSKTIMFNLPKDDFHGYAMIEDNGLSYDNSYYFSLTKAEKINVLSIGDDAKSAFLKKIYTNDEFVYSNFALSALDYNILQKNDIVILNELVEIPQALQVTLKSFSEKGGSVVLIPSAEASLSNLNDFVSNFGNIKFNSSENKSKLITKIAFGHPLYSGVFERKADNFQYPKTSASFVVSSLAPAALSYEDNSNFLTALHRETTAIYIFAAPINKENSNFQNSPLIVPTFYNMAQTAVRSGITTLTIGNAKPLLVDAMLSKDEILDVRNESEKFIPIQQVSFNKVRLTFAEAPQMAGNFAIYNKDQLLKNISFNYPRTEGNLQPTDVELPDNYKSVSSVDEIFTTLQTDRTSDEIWKLFVILGLLFLIAEIFIQKFVK